MLLCACIYYVCVEQQWSSSGISFLLFKVHKESRLDRLSNTHIFSSLPSSIFFCCSTFSRFLSLPFTHSFQYHHRHHTLLLLRFLFAHNFVLLLLLLLICLMLVVVWCSTAVFFCCYAIHSQVKLKECWSRLYSFSWGFSGHRFYCSWMKMCVMQDSSRQDTWKAGMIREKKLGSTPFFPRTRIPNLHKFSRSLFS